MVISTQEDNINPTISTFTEVFTVQGDNQNSALNLLHQKTGLSKKDLKLAAMNGAIWISKSQQASSNKRPKAERLRRLKRVLLDTQKIDLYYNSQLLQQSVQTPTLIADAKLYSVWIKPRGMLSQGSKWADHTALYRWVEMHAFNDENQTRQCWIVHRLDRATCGIMLLAHSKKLAAQLSQLFEDRETQKSYKAWVWGKPNFSTKTINSPIDEKSAISHLSLIVYSANTDTSLVEIKIETGRKHQIRKHLASIGYPIVGDRLHGNLQRNQGLNNILMNQFDKELDLQLTAYRLEFICPIKNTNQCFELNDSELDFIDFNDLPL